MPREAPVPTIPQQQKHAHGELYAKFVHALVPWSAYAGLTLFANVMLAAAHFYPPVGKWMWLTALLSGVIGTAVAGFDLHIRRGRMSVVGMLIGPLTIEAAALMTVIFLEAGYHVPLVLLWLFGGIGACLVWDIWLFGAAHHDLSARFGSAAVESGLGPARLMLNRSPKRERKAITAGSRARGPQRAAQDAPPLPATAPFAMPAAPSYPASPASAGDTAPLRRDPADLPRPPAVPGRRGPARQTGTVAFPGGAVTPDEAAEAKIRLEGALHYPPGAISMSPHGRDAAAADVVISDPAVLSESLPWPGPSFPGGTMADPIRLGLRQDAEYLWIHLLPLFHLRISGSTGTAKTMAGMWNFFAECVTRQEFAGFVLDKVKRNQFAGPLETALHGLDITDEAILKRMLAFRRAREARLDYMAARGITEWAPGCGLSFLTAWMEEAPSTLNALVEMSRSLAGDQRLARRDKTAGPARSEIFTLDDWAEGAKTDRSAGEQWVFSNQLGLTTEIPAVARGQFMGTWCFGTADKKESKIGLSEQQYQAGCDPHSWRSRYPGKMFADVPTMDVADISMPARLFRWASADAVRAYMDQWPAEQRPLDEVTAAAMADEPALPDSYYQARPPALERGPGRPRKDGQPPHRSDPRDNVRKVNFGQNGTDKRESADEAEQVVAEQLAVWYTEGKTVFAFDELTKAGLWPGAGEGAGGRTGRARPWGYNAVRSMCQLGYAEELPGGGRKRWKILPSVIDWREEM